MYRKMEYPKSCIYLPYSIISVKYAFEYKKSHMTDKHTGSSSSYTLEGNKQN